LPKVNQFIIEANGNNPCLLGNFIFIFNPNNKIMYSCKAIFFLLAITDQIEEGLEASKDIM